MGNSQSSDQPKMTEASSATDAGEGGIKIPASKIEPTNEGDSLESLNVEIPLGIKLTGGLKFREEGYTGKGVKVAVIDSGIDETHPGFDGKVTRKQWYRDGTPLSRDFHGTHVAGTVHLMAPEAEIYDYRVFGRRGLDILTAIVNAIDQAREDGCKVINMSLGGPVRFPSIEKAIKRAYDAGIIIVVAAGKWKFAATASTIYSNAKQNAKLNFSSCR